ncbi:MAG: calcium-binding protein [bacterium]|nr:calcium-binding protein [bacterium]
MFTTEIHLGGNDVITGGADNIILGGYGHDRITLGGGTNTVLGDNGYVTRSADGTVTQVTTTDTEDTSGGVDTITSEGGTNVILGGVGGDRISAPFGTNIILGDNGTVNLNNQDSNDIFTTDPELGGDDIISGGVGDNIILGGAGSDLISGGSGVDIALGDNGIVRRDGDHNVLSIETTHPDIGGDDKISGSDNKDIILGGFGDDLLFGGADDDIVIGDNGSVDLTGPKPTAVSSNPDVDGVESGGEDRIHGDGGHDFLFGGGGDDEMFGELGRDTLFGQGGNDTMLGDTGQVLRALNDDGTPRLNVNGSWHRDVFLEKIGTVTGWIRTDRTPLTGELELAARLLGADLVIVTGGFDDASGGDKSLDAQFGNWETGLLLIDLTAADNDVLHGGDGEDVIFGQRGSDLLRGDADADLLFGDGARNTLPFDTDMPHIYDGIRLMDVAADAGISFDFGPGGSVIVPPTTLRPQELELASPYGPSLGSLGVDVLPDSVRAMLNLTGAGLLQRMDAPSWLRPYLSIVPDVVGHEGMLPGNDNIRGGGGDDLIVGDDLEIRAELVTGFREIDRDARNRVWEALRPALDGLHALGLDFHQLRDDLGLVAPGQTLRFGNDDIDAGSGDDVIVGDDALVLGEFILGMPVDGAQYEETALEIYDHLRDLEMLALDLDFTVFEAHHQVLAERIDIAVAAGQFNGRYNLPDPDLFDLELGNDTISAGAGDDLVVGDTATFVTPEVLGTRFHLGRGSGDDDNDDDEFESATASVEAPQDAPTVDFGRTDDGASAPSDDDDDDDDDDDSGLPTDLPVSYSVLVSTRNALQLRDAQRDSEIWIHRYTDHDLQDRWHSGSQLNRISQDFEYDVVVGNDDVQGGSGDDLLIGDFALLAAPWVQTAPTTTWQEYDLAHDVDRLLRDVEDWLQDEYRRRDRDNNHHHTRYLDRGNDSMLVTAGNDELLGLDGADIIFGDSTRIASVFVIDDPNARLVLPSVGDDDWYGGDDDDDDDDDDGDDDGGGTIRDFDRYRHYRVAHAHRDDRTVLAIDGDTILGGDGDDLLFGQQGADIVSGEAGNDVVFGGTTGYGDDDDDSDAYTSDGAAVVVGPDGATATEFGRAGDAANATADDDDDDSDYDVVSGGPGADYVRGNGSNHAYGTYATLPEDYLFGALGDHLGQALLDAGNAADGVPTAYDVDMAAFVNLGGEVAGEEPPTPEPPTTPGPGRGPERVAIPNPGAEWGYLDGTAVDFASQESNSSADTTAQQPVEWVVDPEVEGDTPVAAEEQAREDARGALTTYRPVQNARTDGEKESDSVDAGPERREVDERRREEMRKRRDRGGEPSWLIDL